MSIRTTNFDALAASAPLDRQASVVRDGRGDHWEAKIQPWHAHWDAPPLPEAPPPNCHSYEDLTGRVFGRMAALRYHGPGKGSARWLVRCACGSYELRRAKVIKTMDDPDHSCAACERLRMLRKQASGVSTPTTRKVAADFLDTLASQSRGAQP